LLYAWVYEGGGTRTDDLGITRQEVLEGFRQFSYGL
jgi:hypothetical protein